MNGDKLSRFLAYVLRHNPDDIKLSLDEEGWASVDELIKNAKKFKKTIIEFKDIEEVVLTCPKQRYALTPNLSMIRANQGHSLKEVKITFKEQIPNDILFHGTATRFLDSIYKNGILPQSRNFVHLSDNEETAIAVGKRHGNPIVLRIDAAAMVKDGYVFHISENGVWLVNEIKVKYLM